MTTPTETRAILRTSLMPAISAEPEPQANYAHFLVAQNAEIGTIAHPLSDGVEFMIGRTEDADLTLADPGVSSRHASFRLGGGNVTVTDLGSTNGTFVDGRRVVRPTELPIGSRVRVGSTILHHELRDRDELHRQSQVAEDLAAARRYIEALLPEPRLTGPVRTDWTFVPCAALAGDAFGMVDLDDETVALFLIDAAGHGARSALHSVSVINLLRNRSLPNADFREPASVLARLNDAFPMEQHDGIYFTIWYGVYERRARRLSYGSAGHPAALLLVPGSKFRSLKTPGPPIGTFEGARYFSAQTEVPRSSRLCIFSDGVYEIITKAGCDWTQEQFADLVTAHHASTLTSRGLYEAVRALSRSESLDDDFSLLLASFDD